MKLRCGKTVYERKDVDAEWTHTDYQSISLAKKANGLNSAVTTKPPHAFYRPKDKP